MNLKSHLSNLRDYIKESNKTNSNNDKIAVLEKYKDNQFVTKVLHFTYNNQLQFNVSVANLRKNKDICASENMYNAEGETGENLFAMLMDLHERNISGHSAISCVNAFIKEYCEFEHEISLIIDRNLQTRVTGTIINKVIKGLIPEFEVALGYDYDSLDERLEPKIIAKAKAKVEQMAIKGNLPRVGMTFDEAVQYVLDNQYDKRPNLVDGTWYLSRKMDGLRAIAHVDEMGDSILRSREGNIFTTFGVIQEHIKSMGFRDCVLDGEICLIHPDGSDDFNGIQKEFRKKDHTMANARYRLFDILTHDEFVARTSHDDLKNRMMMMDDVFESIKIIGKNNDIIAPIEQTLITSQEQLDAMRAEAAQKNWEGLIGRKNVRYEGRRTLNLLKLKLFIEAEFLVTGVDVGPMRVIEYFGENDEKVSREVTKDTFLAATVDFYGEPVQVGSGYSKEQRETFYDDNHLILGKLITVRYYRPTTNKQGTSKMRFPTFKCLKEKF